MSPVFWRRNSQTSVQRSLRVAIKATHLQVVPGRIYNLWRPNNQLDSPDTLAQNIDRLKLTVILFFLFPGNGRIQLSSKDPALRATMLTLDTVRFDQLRQIHH